MEFDEYLEATAETERVIEAEIARLVRLGIDPRVIEKDVPRALHRAINELRKGSGKRPLRLASVLIAVKK
jgi:hypothetical protein